MAEYSYAPKLPSPQAFKRLRDSEGWGQITLDLTQLQSQYAANCTIGLMAAKGQDSFYAQFGFTARPSNVYGAGMIAPLGNIRLK